MKVFTIVALLILITIPAFSGGQAETQPMGDKTMEDDSMGDQPAMENTAMESDMGMDSKMSPFIEYKDASQAMMLAEEKPTVLFFNASWCPTCKAAREDFTANAAKLKDVNLILVDYDNSDALQKKYGVTYQHTFVLIDPDGNAISKWNGGATMELLDNIKMKEM